MSDAPKDPPPAPPEKVPISKALVLTNVASQVVTHGLNITVLVWLNQYLIRMVDTEEYELYPIVLAPMVLVPVLTAFLGTATSRYLIEAYAKQESDRVISIVSTVTPYYASLASVLLAFGGIFAWNIDHILTIRDAGLVRDAQLMFGLLVAATAFRVALAPYAQGMMIRQRFVIRNLLELATHLLRNALLLALIFGVGPRVLWVVVAAVSAESLGFCVRIWVSRRLVPELRFRRQSREPELGRELIAFGGWTLLQNVATAMRRGAHVVVLNKLAYDLDVAAFHLAALVRNQIQIVVRNITAPLLPPLVAMHTHGKKEALASVYLRGGRIALWITMTAITPIFVFRRQLVELYIPTKVDLHEIVIGALALILPVIPITQGNLMMGRLALATRRIRPVAVLALLQQTIALLACIVLVGVFDMGVVGAAWAIFGTAVVIQPCLSWPLGRRLADVTWKTWFLETFLRGCGPALATAGFWYLCDHWMHLDQPTWTRLGSVIAVGWVLYGAVTLALMTQVDRQDLRFALRAARNVLRGRKPTA